MGVDHHWGAVYEAVFEALLNDRELHRHPPGSEEEVGFVAETVTDHLVGAFVLTRRDGPARSN